MKSSSCFPFFFYTGEESLFLGHPCELLEVDRHANLLEQKRPLLHEGLKICSLVNLFTLGVVGALHKTFYLDWAEVSLFTEQLCLSSPVGFLLSHSLAWISCPTLCSHMCPEQLPFAQLEFPLCHTHLTPVCASLSLVLKTASHFQFDLVTAWPMSDILITLYHLIWLWILGNLFFFFGNFCGGCLLGEAQAFIISVTTVWIISLLNLGLGLFLLSKHCIKASGSFSNGTWNLLG